MTLVQALQGSSAPTAVLDKQVLVGVYYLSFDGKIHRGQLVLRKDLVVEVREIFWKMLEWRFPVGKVVPAAVYGWNDERMMADNNCSAFNYRFIRGSQQLSNHSYGTAIDINPVQNPYVAATGEVFPAGAQYLPARLGTLVAGDRVVRLWESRGWFWGGRGIGVRGKIDKDWQHLEKR